MNDFLNSIEQLPLSVWVRDSGSIWSYPTVLFLHTLGMSMVAGGSAAIALVLLGFWPNTPIKPLERTFPLIWIGFWINAITGTILLMTEATAKATSYDFGIKMAFIAGGVALISLTRKKVFQTSVHEKRPLPASAKGLAWASLICWFGAITAGRLLAYLAPSGASSVGLPK